MARPRKKYPFENIEPGKSRKFTIVRYTGRELRCMLAALYRRRLPDGSPMFAAASQIVNGDYTAITVTRAPDVTGNSPAPEIHGMLRETE